ncbi:MAG: hypothetical protein WA066_01555, partial [Candidatus Omnitrophota bacterium]
VEAIAKDKELSLEQQEALNKCIYLESAISSPASSPVSSWVTAVVYQVPGLKGASSPVMPKEAILNSGNESLDDVFEEEIAEKYSNMKLSEIESSSYFLEFNVANQYFMLTAFIDSLSGSAGEILHHFRAPISRIKFVLSAMDSMKRKGTLTKEREEQYNKLMRRWTISEEATAASPAENSKKWPLSSPFKISPSTRSLASLRTSSLHSSSSSPLASLRNIGVAIRGLAQGFGGILIKPGKCLRGKIITLGGRFGNPEALFLASAWALSAIVFGVVMFCCFFFSSSELKFTPVVVPLCGCYFFFTLKTVGGASFLRSVFFVKGILYDELQHAWLSGILSVAVITSIATTWYWSILTVVVAGLFLYGYFLHGIPQDTFPSGQDTTGKSETGKEKENGVSGPYRQDKSLTPRDPRWAKKDNRLPGDPAQIEAAIQKEIQGNQPFSRSPLKARQKIMASRGIDIGKFVPLVINNFIIQTEVFRNPAAYSLRQKQLEELFKDRLSSSPVMSIPDLISRPNEISKVRERIISNKDEIVYWIHPFGETNQWIRGCVVEAKKRLTEFNVEIKGEYTFPAGMA